MSPIHRETSWRTMQPVMKTGMYAAGKFLLTSSRMERHLSMPFFASTHSITIIAIPPVIDDGIAGLGQPRHVLSQAHQCNCRKEFTAVSGRRSQGLQEACGNENGNFVDSKSQIPGGFIGSQSGWRVSQIQKLAAFGIHAIRSYFFCGLIPLSSRNLTTTHPQMSGVT